jgi:hypothetical protein
MTVKELREQLSHFPDYMEIVRFSSGSSEGPPAASTLKCAAVDTHEVYDYSSKASNQYKLLNAVVFEWGEFL